MRRKVGYIGQAFNNKLTFAEDTKHDSHRLQTCLKLLLQTTTSGSYYSSSLVIT